MPVIIGGMYRNGTTFVASIMKDVLGYYGGTPPDLKPQNLEYRRIIKLSNKALKRFGGAAFHPKHVKQFVDTFDYETFDYSQMEFWDMFAYNALYKLNMEKGESEDIFWKDTRLPLTLPFWYRVVLNGKYIFCYRHPDHAIPSMHNMRKKWRRFNHTYPYENGIYLWETYYERLLGYLNIIDDIDCIGIDYKDWICDFDRTVYRLNSFLKCDIDISKLNAIFNPQKEISDFDNLSDNSVYNSLRDLFNGQEI